MVGFDDVGNQPVTLQAYELVSVGDPGIGEEVIAVTEGSRLTLRRT